MALTSAQAIQILNSFDPVTGNPLINTAQDLQSLISQLDVTVFGKVRFKK
jgi:hypothetical protein